MNHRVLVFLMIYVGSLTCSVNAQTSSTSTFSVEKTSSVDEKSKQIMDRAIEVLGGANYLSVKTVIGRGFYTQMNDGVSQLPDRKSTRLNSSHLVISYAVFCLK